MNNYFKLMPILIIFIVFVVIVCNTQYAESAGICDGKNANINCLVENYEKLYKGNQKLFWNILNEAGQKAIKGEAVEDILDFFKLIGSIKNNAEVSEFFGEVNERLIQSHPETYYEAFQILDTKDKIKLIQFLKYPITMPKEQMDKIIIDYKAKRLYPEIVDHYLAEDVKKITPSDKKPRTQEYVSLSKGEFLLDYGEKSGGSVVTVKASSTLGAVKDINYRAKNASDFDASTAWVEGKSDYGKGEYLEYKYDFRGVKNTNFHVTNLLVHNGYCKNQDIWHANSRIKELKLTLNGHILNNIYLKDIWDMQIISIPKITFEPGKKYILRCEIIDVYKGKKYKDTAISELHFVNVEN